ncbi:hypothetical protein CBM2587_B20069 [Cupriavidus taiwanensis]|uniref:Uncharacterized protein n=1 Tax=Cupriavidus taiwanensis TaxID=164546 RepID=A0A975X7B9_9BURK|nr:hypothetical protein CBM2587_B20069 [Cupriavidus taiwanensis]
MAQPLRRCAPEPDQYAGGEKQPGDLRFRDHGHGGQRQVDRPQQFVAAHALGGQLIGADGNDADDGGAHPIEHRLHPGQSAKADISPAQSQHHEKRRQHECQTNQRCAANAVMHVAEIDGELRGQRAWCQLRQRKPFLVVAIGDPATPLHQVAVHIAGQGYRAAEAKGPQAEEIGHQLPEGIGGMVRGLLWCHGFGRIDSGSSDAHARGGTGHRKRDEPQRPGWSRCGHGRMVEACNGYFNVLTTKKRMRDRPRPVQQLRAGRALWRRITVESTVGQVAECIACSREDGSAAAAEPDDGVS